MLYGLISWGANRMKDHENLTPQAARFVKQEIELAMRFHFNGNIEGVFNTLSRLQLNCIRALDNAAPQDSRQIPLDLTPRP